MAKQSWARIQMLIDAELHDKFKAAVALRRTKMTAVLLEFIEDYVARNLPGSTAKKKR